GRLPRLSVLQRPPQVIQIGLRGALEHTEPWEAARRDGVDIVTSERIVSEGAERALADVRPSGDTYVTIDTDVLDPAVAAGTGCPEPGGIGYYQLKQALLLVAERTSIIAFDICEMNPTYDSGAVNARIAARLMLDLLGA